jgi:hypothetical protein
MSLDLATLTTQELIDRFRQAHDETLRNSQIESTDLDQGFATFKDHRASTPPEDIQQVDLDCTLALFEASRAKNARDLKWYGQAVGGLLALLERTQSSEAAPASLTWPELIERTFRASMDLPAVPSEEASADLRKGIAIWMNCSVRPKTPRTPPTPPARENDDD